MGEIMKLNTDNDLVMSNDNTKLSEITDALLIDARSALDDKKILSVPIAQLSALGAGVASLIPAFNTVTQTTKIATDGLYTLANAEVGDTLKVAKNGNLWGAFKRADGTSKLAQLQSVDSISATNTVSALNPATIMMAAALFSIEQELGKIEDMQKRILSFLEVEKESEIEADVETLMGILHKYKLNWDNEHYVASNHKLALDIQRTARKNINVYQKKISDTIEKKHLIASKTNVKQMYTDLEKDFKYYRLSLYTFSLSSLIEIMLSGNFNEEYIMGIKTEICEMTDAYRDLFEKSSCHLEELSGSALEVNVLKGVGHASKAVGKFIGSIPLIKKGAVDEFLQDSGDNIKKNAIGIENKEVHSFASVSNPGTRVFIDKMEDFIQIYNHTDKISFDNQKIYLIAN